jgi:hypothetical protein
MGQRAAVVARRRKGPDCGGLPPWFALARLSSLKDKDQKAERAVVHALGPAVAVGRGKAPAAVAAMAGASEESRIPDPA